MIFTRMQKNRKKFDHQELFGFSSSPTLVRLALTTTTAVIARGTSERPIKGSVSNADMIDVTALGAMHVAALRVSRSDDPCSLAFYRIGEVSSGELRYEYSMPREVMSATNDKRANGRSTDI